jgi:hypothetical protein
MSGLPSWRGSPAVLPGISIRPGSDGGWTASVWVPGSGIWTSREVSTTFKEFCWLEQLLVEWEKDPEESLRRFFNTEPPGVGGLATGKNLDDLF